MDQIGLVIGIILFLIILVMAWIEKREKEKNIVLRYDATIRTAHETAEKMSDADLDKLLHDKLSDADKKT